MPYASQAQALAAQKKIKELFKGAPNPQFRGTDLTQDLTSREWKVVVYTVDHTKDGSIPNELDGVRIERRVIGPRRELPNFEDDAFLKR